MKFRSLALLVLLGGALSACSFSLAEDITPPPDYVSPTPMPTVGPLYPAEPPSPVRGAAIYAAHCAACHGADGLGNGALATEMPVTVPSIGLQEIASQYSPADWFTEVTRGSLSRGMPPFDSLTAQQRWDALAYVYSLSAPADTQAHAATLYAAQCAACHGATGRGDGPQAAGLNPAPTNFTDETLLSKLSGADLYRAIAQGVSPGMQAFAQLSQDDTWALVGYVRALGFDLSAPTATPVPTQAASPTAGTPGAPAAAAAGTPAATPVPGQQTGSASGTVSLSAGGALPSGLSVELRGFDPAATTAGNPTEVLTLTEPLAADGSYAFQDVAMPAGRMFIAQVEYANVPYQSDFVTAAQGSTSLNLPALVLYPSTADLNALTLEQAHIILDASTSGSLQVVELYILTNTGANTVLVPSDGTNIPFIKLPDGASNVSFQVASGSAPFLGTGTGFAVVPASADQKYGLVAVFDLPYTSKLSVDLPFVLAANAVTLLAPEGVTVAGTGITDGGVQAIQGTNYHVFNGPALGANADLAVTISGTPKAASAATTSSNRNALMIGAGGLGLVLIGLGAFLFLRDRARGGEPEGAGEADALGNDPDGITDAIIALDEKFKAGELGRDAYAARRAELKDRLRKALE